MFFNPFLGCLSEFFVSHFLVKFTICSDMSCQAVKRRKILVGNEFFGVLMLCFGSGIFLWVSKLLFVENKYKGSPCTKQTLVHWDLEYFLSKI